MTTKSEPYSLVKPISVIWWQDAYVTTDDSAELGNGSHLTCSVGFIDKEDAEFVYMSHFYDGISHTLQGPFTAIPKGMIKNTETIKRKESKVSMAKAPVKKMKSIAKSKKSKKSC